jgi:hypothetical protein
VLRIAHFQEQWNARVGSSESDSGALSMTQIAARGPLIAVASRGQPGVSDALDGVHVLDGRKRRDGDLTSRELRVLVAPQVPGARPGLTDTVGVALDGDFVVFASYGGVVTRMRLDGREAWAQSPLPPGSRPGLPALVDLNGDGILDVVVPVVPTIDCRNAQGCGGPWDDLALALDGYTGNTLWTIDGEAEFRAGKSGAANHPCRVPLIGSDSSAKRLYVACSLDLDITVRAFGFDGKRADDTACGASACSAAELSGRFVASTVQLANGLGGQAADSYWLEVSGSRLLAQPVASKSFYDPGVDWSTLISKLRPAASADSVEVARLSSVIQTPPTLADPDADGIWDVLLVENGVLHVLSTGAAGDARNPLWRSNLAASGDPPSALDTPAAYASRVQARDTTRWLAVNRDPDDAAFQPVTDASTVNALGAQFKAAEPIDLPRVAEPKRPVVQPSLPCGGTYGVNEGSLVQQKAGEWQLVQGAPWPIFGIGCSGSNLELKTTDGRFYELHTPPVWQNYAIGMLTLVIVACAALAGFLLLRKPPLLAPAEASGHSARQVVVADTPHGVRASAHPAQQRLLDGLLNMLDNADTRPSVTLALYGPWGSGKSSIMQMLRSELRDTGRYIDVWFNAWRYHRESDMSAALLQTIVDEVGKKTDWGTRFAMLWNRVRAATLRDVASVLIPVFAVAVLLAVAVRTTEKTFATSLLNGTTLASLLALVATGGRRVLTPLFKVFSLEPAKLLASGSSTQRIQFVSAFPAEFEKVVSKLPRGTRLILFIDDLDRCAPDRIVDVLETLSMLADTGRGFFVLALDPTTVRRAIELKYEDVLRLARRDNAADGAHFGLRYLEKMITLGINVPPLAAVDVEPDQRLLEPAPERSSRAAWWQNVAPQGPLLLGCALVLALSGLLWRYPARAAQLLDECTQVASQFLEPEGAKLSPSTALPAAPKPEAVVATLNAERPSEPAPAAGASDRSLRSASVRSPLEAQSAPLEGVQRAPVLPAPTPPALVETRARPTPSVAIRHGDFLLMTSLVLGFACLLALGSFAWSEWQRRKKIRAARPMSRDSLVFSQALQRCKAQLPANPRSVLRFTNLARFLYQIVSSTENPADSGWEIGFLRALCARWLGRRESSGNVQLDAEIERWVPNDGSELDAAGTQPGT